MRTKKLYKKNNEGKIEVWSIIAERKWRISPTSGAGYKWGYEIQFGELKGKQQKKETIIEEGKNIGKKNETSVQQQCESEAQSKYEKKLKEGYVKSLKAAEAGKTDSVIKGGIIPMLAHKFEDHKDKIDFPIAVQPKLDGQRCIAHFKDGKVTLWTRTRKEITSCPHIIHRLHLMFVGCGIKKETYLDGELYNHELKSDFEKLMSAVRKQKPSPESSMIQYHIYDFDIGYKKQFFIDRYKTMCDKLPDDFTGTIQLVETNIIENETRLFRRLSEFIEDGYEGLMIRDLNSHYENKRSKNLLKMKEFSDDEFKVKDVVPGKDNTVVFVCETKTGKKFEATKSGDKKLNQKYLKNKKKFIGKPLTVKYQGLTGKNKVPRFPVALRIREDI